METIHKSISSFFVFSKDLNFGDTLFGGKLMAELDLEASKVVKSLIYDTAADNCVTASFDKIDFKYPAKKGDLIQLEADIVGLGRSSVKIDVTAWIKRGIHRDEWIEICHAHTTFVCLKDGMSYRHNKKLEDIIDESKDII
jgi:acyl-CoA thioesterase YciA